MEEPRNDEFLLGAVPTNSTPGKLTYICHFERVGTETNKFEKCEFIFILTRRLHSCWLLHIMLGFFFEHFSDARALSII